MVALLAAGLAFPAAACADDGSPDERAAESAAASPTVAAPAALAERSSSLLGALARAAGDAYGRTAVTSPQPRDRFLRQVVERSGVLDEARAAGLPLDLLVDSYVATAGAGGGGSIELLDTRDENVAAELAALLASGGTPSRRSVAAAAPIAGERGWLLTCAAVEPPATPLFVAVVATRGVVLVAQEAAPRVDQVAALVVRELQAVEGPNAGER